MSYNIKNYRRIVLLPILYTIYFGRKEPGAFYEGIWMTPAKFSILFMLEILIATLPGRKLDFLSGNILIATHKTLEINVNFRGSKFRI